MWECYVGWVIVKEKLNGNECLWENVVMAPIKKKKWQTQTSDKLECDRSVEAPIRKVDQINDSSNY